MSWLENALSETASYPTAESLSTFEAHIDARWIEEALEATGTATLRRRRLPAEQVVWLVLGMGLMRDRPMEEVVKKLDLVLPGSGQGKTVARSTVAQARQRLGPAPMRWLFERCSQVWAGKSAGAHPWKGLALYALDGTTLRVADSDDNRAHFGVVQGRRESSYPIVRLAALIAARSHLIVGAAFGPYSHSEHHYAEGLWSQVPPNSLTLVDRNFLSARILLGLQNGTNRHWLVRAKSHTSWTLLKKLGHDDLLVEMKVSSAARQHDRSLPTTFQARAIGYSVDSSKPKQWLLTSLLDPAKFTAREVTLAYHERWEIELAYDELKTHQLDRLETLRSRSVKGVEQELWGILLTYNLVRFEMERIAEEAKLPPSRISFVTAMRYIRDEWEWCAISSTPGSIPMKLRRMRDKILDFVLPERRSKRRFPRAVKLKMSNYPRKRRPSMLAK